MEEILLHAQARKEEGKSKIKDLRQTGFVPAVIYGAERTAQNLKLSHHELIQVIHQRGIEGVLIQLIIDEGKKKPCVVKEIQYDPVHSEILHVDFNEISLTKALKIKVPVACDGEAVGVKQDGGSLEQILWEAEVECLPTAIPNKLEVNVASLKIGDSIFVKDMKLPEGVKLLEDPEAIVVTVSAPMKEEVAVEPVEGAETQEPEVIREKKEVAEEGAAPAGKKEEKEKK